MQVTHTKQYRQTTTMCEDLQGEQTIEQQQPAHKQGVYLCMLGGNHRSWAESVVEREGEMKKGSQKVRVGVKVELSSKQSQIPPAPPHSQVNRAPVHTKTMF